jgi:hypothetical protein
MEDLDNKYRKAFILANVENMIFSLLSIVWGIWLLTPALFTVTSIMNPVESVFPSILIALLFIISGTIKSVGIFLPRTNILPLGGMMGFVLWVFVWILTIMVAPDSSMVITAPFLAMWNGWVYIRYRLASSF